MFSLCVVVSLLLLFCLKLVVEGSLCFEGHLGWEIVLGVNNIDTIHYTGDMREEKVAGSFFLFFCRQFRRRRLLR